MLQRLLPRLAGAAGFTTQAYVLNALALLFRRLGEHEQALRHVKEAVPLAVLSGDFTLIQSVLFNFGNIISEVRRTSPDVAKDVDPLALLEMDLAIRKQFGLGKDSAQGELLLAYLAWEEGSHRRARGYLQTAEEIIAVSKVPADRALFHRVSGLVKIAAADGKPCPEGIEDLKTAITLFDSIGNKASADYVRGELASQLAIWS